MPVNQFDFNEFIKERTAEFVGRQWVFDDIDEWLDDPDAPSFFIITGGPGTGKSAIAARLTQRYALAAYHFCIARDAETINPYPFARSISQQLCRMPAFAAGIVTAGQSRIEVDLDIEENYGEVIGVKIEKLENLVINAPSAAVAFSQAVTQPLRALPKPQDEDKDKVTVLILVDALDEAVRHQGPQTIVDLLANMGQLSPHVRFILTSRPEGAALEHFEQRQVPYFQLDAEREENRTDIGAYVRRRLQASAPLRQRLADSSWAQDAFITQVEKRSQGNFLYVVYLLRAIAMGQRSLQGDDGLPTGLDGVYAEFLRTRLPSPRSPAWRYELRPLLGVLAAARAPLTAVQVRAFSGLDPQAARDLLGDVEQFLDPTAYAEGRHQFYHQSLPDFLTDEEKAGSYWIDLQPVHEGIIDHYRPSDGAWDTVDWESVDDYGLAHLPAHLQQVGQMDALEALLFSYGRMAARLRRDGIRELIADYDLREDASRRSALGLVQGALQLSTHALSEDKNQLAGQLVGRLSGFKHITIRELLEAARAKQDGTWLRPAMGRLTQPGGLTLFRLEGHNAWVNAVALTPDGRQAVSASSDGTLRVWDLATGQAGPVLGGHAQWVTAVAVTPNGGQAVSASVDHTLRVWDLATGQAGPVLEGHNDMVNAVALTPDGRQAVSASEDCTLRVWALATGCAGPVLEGHTGPVKVVAVTPDGQRAVSASKDHNLRIWDLVTGQAGPVLVGHKGSVVGIAITPDGRRALSASEDGTLRVWDLATGQLGLVLTGHNHWVNAVAVTPDGQHAVSASADGTLRVWDLATGKLGSVLEGHTAPVTAVAVTPDGRQAVSSSLDWTLRVWDLTMIQPGTVLEGHSDRVLTVAITPDGRRAISASEDCTLRVWDLATRSASSVLERHTGRVCAVAVARDGRYAVSASADGTLRIWDLAAGQPGPVLDGHTGSVNAVAVTPDGRSAVSASDDCTLRVWDLDTGQIGLVLEGHTGGVHAVAVTPDGQRAVSASDDCTLRVWDLAEGRAGPVLEGHNSAVTAVAVAPNGRQAVSASWDKDLRVWDLATGQPGPVLKGHTSWVNTLAVTPDGQRAVSASDDCTLRVWDLATGQIGPILMGHTSWVRAVAVTPDGQQAVSASIDSTLRVWNLNTGGAGAVLEGHTDIVFAVAVMPNGRLAVSSSRDNSLRVWDLVTGASVCHFYLDAPSEAVAWDGNRRLVVGDVVGNVFLFELRSRDS